MADEIQKLQSDILAVNAGVREVNERLNEIVAGQSYAEIDVAIAGGQTITSISLAGTGLKGKIPSGAFFLLSYPDGSLPKAIENQGSDLEVGDTTISISQTVVTDVPYPVGSLISSVNYATNDSQFAAGNTTEVQYNGSGELAADSNFTFDSATETLEVTNATISGTITGDLTGNVTGDVTGDLTGNVTSTSVLDDGVTATTQADATSNLTVATTEFVMNNAGQDPAGTTLVGYHPIQFNDDGNFGAGGAFDLGYNDSTKVLSVNALIVNVNATVAGILTAQSTIELGNSDTTLSRISAGVVGIEGKEIVTKNKQRHVINCGFYHSTSSIVYLPFGYGGTNDSTSSSGYLEFGGYVAPCDGYVDYVVVRGEAPGSHTTVGFVKAGAGTEVPVLSGASGLSDTVNMLYDDTAYRFDNFRNQGGVVTNTFSAGDVIMFTLNTTNPLYDAIATAVLVFDWDNEL